ncbi:hypothetical protein [uncultured Hymenobacter sp.]|uniref:hypothetical protein n=1 Tax=uncultured Hymenobacter sp. TaxID=170016 RepID=UPI0035CC97EA
MRFSLLFGLLALSAQLAAAQAPARPATVKTKTKTAGLPSAKSKSGTALATTRSGAPAEAGPTPSLDDERVAARANALTDNMRAALALTPQQTEKVRTINTTGVRNVEQARLRYRTNPRKLQAYIEDVGSSRLSALKDVLTPAQFNKYQRKREEKMGLPSAPATTGTAVPGLPGGAVE